VAACFARSQLEKGDIMTFYRKKFLAKIRARHEALRLESQQQQAALDVIERFGVDAVRKALRENTPPRVEVKFRKEEPTMETITKKPRTGADARREPFTFELALDRAFREHNAGKLSNVELSEITAGLARSEFGGDKDSMAKHVAKYAMQYAQKAADDYTRSQRGSSPVHEGDDLAEAHAAERERAVGDGRGYHRPQTTGPHPNTAANIDDSDLESPTDGVIKSDVFKRVAARLISEGMTSDQAWSAVHKYERRESLGW
jgi:hypothetical protein